MVMDYRNWITRFGRMAEAVRARHAEVEELSIEPPVPEDEMARLEEYTARTNGLPSFRFDAALRGLHRVAGGVAFRWRWIDRGTAPPISGRMHLSPITLLYDSEVGGQPWHDVWRIMDEVSAIEQIVCRFEARTGAPALGWRSTEGGGESITPLSLTVDDYLDLSVAACCLSYWPLLFAHDRAVLGSESREHLFAALHALEPASRPDVLRRRLSTR